MKDRTTLEHGQKNLPWGTGDTPTDGAAPDGEEQVGHAGDD
jgi:hypothetical protein